MPKQNDGLRESRATRSLQPVSSRASSFLPERASTGLLTERQQALHQRRAAAAGVQGRGDRLPHLEKIQKHFGGHDLSTVRAYTGPRAARANEQIGAEAYAMGNRVAFRSRHPDFHTTAHETAHVLQQMAGIHVPGGVGRPGDRYERQADAAANAIHHGNEPTASRKTIRPRNVALADAPVQMLEIGKEPVNPAAYRTTTDLTAPVGTNFGGMHNAGVFADTAFSVGQRNEIIGNNNANALAAPGPAPAAAVPFFNSDESGNGLLDFAPAAQVSPEIDHIVERADGGSNSINNARILSSQENNVGPATRPAATLLQTAITVYDDYRVTDLAAGTYVDFPEGQALSIAEANVFYTYATNGAGGYLANTAAFTAQELNAIAVRAGNLNRGGYRIV